MMIIDAERSRLLPRLPPTVGGGAVFAAAGLTGAPAAASRAAGVDEQQRAFGAGAFADALGELAGEQVDGVAGDGAERRFLRTGSRRSKHAFPMAENRNQRRDCCRGVDQCLVGIGRIISGDQGFGAAMNRLAHPPGGVEPAFGDRDRPVEQVGLAVPAGQVPWSAQAFVVAAPAFADGGDERQTQPCGAEVEGQLFGGHVIGRGCVRLHVTSITRDVSEILNEPASGHLSDIEEFLRSRGAADLAHPGGTLLEHLTRVRRRLADWGALPEVQIAGLCHAAYGTDGFARSLLDLAERAVLIELIGERAEKLVYLYASCDRAAVYPRLREGRQPVFHDRFTQTDHEPDTEDLRAFLEITAANELDVFAHNEDLATRHGPGLYRLLEPVRALLSASAWEAVRHDAGVRIADS